MSISLTRSVNWPALKLAANKSFPFCSPGYIPVILNMSWSEYSRSLLLFPFWISGFWGHLNSSSYVPGMFWYETRFRDKRLWLAEASGSLQDLSPRDPVLGWLFARHLLTPLLWVQVMLARRHKNFHFFMNFTLFRWELCIFESLKGLTHGLSKSLNSFLSPQLWWSLVRLSFKFICKYLIVCLKCETFC
jgi:hypothetical protein